MDQAAVDQLRDKALRDLWNRTLGQVSTNFGRLAYLCSLRDANTGRYEHFGLAQIYSREEADQALRWSHAQTFGEWLNSPLAQQKTDLEDYLDNLEGGRQIVLQAWAVLKPYLNVIPVDASEAQRQLFITDLEIILDLLRSETSPSLPNPAA